MNRYLVNFSAMVVAGLVVSCSHARVVQLEPGRGGVVAVSARTSASARERAKSLMADNCPGGAFEIVREGEVVVGATVTTPITTSRVSRNVGVGLGTTSARNATEWRLEYRCTTVAE